MMDGTDEERIAFHRKCLKVAEEVFGKRYQDLEDEQCAIVAQIVNMDLP